jgi:Beta-ketoacyl synthase, N-terminal domain
MRRASSRVYVESVGLFGTGFENWVQGAAILRGEQPFVATDFPLPSPEWLPPAERRRTSDIIRLALCAGREALTSANQAITDTYTVFSSSGGSGEVIHQICESLATAEREVSPTRFHNSVHNAPAGYWGIATRNEWPSTSLCAHDASFAAGVLEAVSQASQCAQPVLLLVHDLRYPEPLNGVRTVAGLFSVALLLRATRTSEAKFSIDVSLAPREAPISTITMTTTQAALENFRTTNPAARSLPLLMTLANRANESVILENVNGTRLKLEVHTL